MARFTQYPAASTADYADATTFLIANSDGEIKQASLQGLGDTYFCDIRCISVTIPSSEVLQLNTTPKVLIPAQGSGTIIDPISCIGKLTNMTSPYATNVTFAIIFQGLVTSPVYTSSVFINSSISPTYHKFEVVQPSIISNLNAYENQDLVAKVQAGNPTGGDADLEILLTYRVIDI